MTTLQALAARYIATTDADTLTTDDVLFAVREVAADHVEGLFADSVEHVAEETFVMLVEARAAALLDVAILRAA